LWLSAGVATAAPKAPSPFQFTCQGLDQSAIRYEVKYVVGPRPFIYREDFSVDSQTRETTVTASLLHLPRTPPGRTVLETVLTGTSHVGADRTVSIALVLDKPFKGIRRISVAAGADRILTGSIDGHQLVPTPLDSASKAQLGDHAKLRLKLPAKYSRLLDKLTRAAALHRSECLGAFPAALSEELPGVPQANPNIFAGVEYVGNNGDHPGCLDCLLSCGITDAGCIGKLIGGGTGAGAGIGAIAGGVGAGAGAVVGAVVGAIAAIFGCAITNADCFDACIMFGHPCCPVHCDGQRQAQGAQSQKCCDAGNVCIIAEEVCCPPNSQPCADFSCCPAGTTCIASGPLSTQCCANNAFCREACCDSGEYCADQALSLCCKNGEEEKDGKCCTGQLACGPTCCGGVADIGGVYCAGQDIGLCCSVFEKRCGSSCCRSDHSCCNDQCCDGDCIGGQCCPTGRSCGKFVCCKEGEFCTDATTGTCSPCKAGTTGCDTGLKDVDGKEITTCCPVPEGTSLPVSCCAPIVGGKRMPQCCAKSTDVCLGEEVGMLDTCCDPVAGAGCAPH